MDAAQLVVEFATLFLGAFVAFGLENRRERRRLRRWARQYLGHLRDGAASDVDNIADDTQQLITSAEAWLQAREATELDDHVWAVLATVPAFHPPDLGAVLHGPALTVLPHDLAGSLSELERDADALASHAATAADHQRATCSQVAREHLQPPANPRAGRRTICRDERRRSAPSAHRTLADPKAADQVRAVLRLGPACTECKSRPRHPPRLHEFFR